MMKELKSQNGSRPVGLGTPVEEKAVD